MPQFEARLNTIKYTDRQSCTDLLQDQCGGVPPPRLLEYIGLILADNVCPIQLFGKLIEEPRS